MKHREVSATTKIALWIFSIVAVGYLGYWFISNMLFVIYISFWLLSYSPVLLLVLISYFVFIRSRKRRDISKLMGMLLIIAGLGALVYLCRWFLTSSWFLTGFLPTLLPIAIGFFAAILFLGDVAPDNTIQTFNSEFGQ